MRFGILSLAIVAIASLTDAHADQRVALVIGNSAYQHVAKLPNPVNDAQAVAALFKRAGFDVVEIRLDLDAANLKRAMRDFTDMARDADVAVVYYAGHGIEVDGNNYLIPVDAVLERDVDVDDETVSVDRVMRALDPVKRLRLVILDACRDNPFTRTMKRTMTSRAIGPRLGQDGTFDLRHADRFCGQGWIDRDGRRWKEQPVYQGAGEASCDPRPRSAHGVRPGAG